MDKPTYVRITKATEKEWYDGRIGEIFPVLFESTAFYYVIRGLAIDKSDCEVVPHRNGQEPGDANWKRGYALGFDRGFKQGQRNPAEPSEGQHLISTERVKELEALVWDYSDRFMSDKIKTWFPAVFQPEKTTYKVGQRFSLKGTPAVFRIVQHAKGAISFLNEIYDLVTPPVPCYDPESISEEEFAELTVWLHEKPEEFTLLPESSDQRA